MQRLTRSKAESGNDSITADVNSRFLTLDGGAGNDTLSIFVDTLTANPVTLRGGTASTDVDTGDVLTIKGGGTLSATNLANVIGWDTWTLASAQAYTLTLNDANVASAATLTINASSATTLTFDGSAEADGTFNLTGTSGVDTITGGTKADILNAGAGADTYKSGASGTDNSNAAVANLDTIFLAEGAGGDILDISAFTAVTEAEMDADNAVGSQFTITDDGTKVLTDGAGVTLTLADAGDISFFNDGTDSFLVIESGDNLNQFNANEDFVVKLVQSDGSTAAVFTDIDGLLDANILGIGFTSTISGTTMTLTIDPLAAIVVDLTAASHSAVFSGGAVPDTLSGTYTQNAILTLNASTLTSAVTVTTVSASASSVTTGSGATTIAGAATSVAVTAGNITNGVALTLQGTQAYTVTGLIGDIAAGSTSGTLNVTTAQNTGDDTISITAGSGTLTVTANGALGGDGIDDVLINAAAMTGSQTLTIGAGTVNDITVTNWASSGALDATGASAGTADIEVTISAATGDTITSTSASTDIVNLGFSGTMDFTGGTLTAIETINFNSAGSVLKLTATQVTAVSTFAGGTASSDKVLADTAATALDVSGKTWTGNAVEILEITGASSTFTVDAAALASVTTFISTTAGGKITANTDLDLTNIDATNTSGVTEVESTKGSAATFTVDTTARLAEFTTFTASTAASILDATALTAIDLSGKTFTNVATVTTTGGDAVFTVDAADLTSTTLTTFVSANAAGTGGKITANTDLDLTNIASATSGVTEVESTKGSAATFTVDAVALAEFTTYTASTTASIITTADTSIDLTNVASLTNVTSFIFNSAGANDGSGVDSLTIQASTSFLTGTTLNVGSGSTDHLHITSTDGMNLVGVTTLLANSSHAGQTSSRNAILIDSNHAGTDAVTLLADSSTDLTELQLRSNDSGNTGDEIISSTGNLDLTGSLLFGIAELKVGTSSAGTLTISSATDLDAANNPDAITITGTDGNDIIKLSDATSFDLSSAVLSGMTILDSAATSGNVTWTMTAAQIDTLTSVTDGGSTAVTVLDAEAETAVDLVTLDTMTGTANKVTSSGNNVTYTVDAVNLADISIFVSASSSGTITTTDQTVLLTNIDANTSGIATVASTNASAATFTVDAVAVGEFTTYSSNVSGGTMQLANGGVTADFSAITLTNIDKITGGTGADVITGTSNAETIDGGADADTITGGGGADTLNGGTGTGNDTFVYVATADLITGTAFVDTIIGGDGTDAIAINNNNGATFTIANTLIFNSNSSSGIEKIIAFGDTNKIISITLSNLVANLGITTVDLSADTDATGDTTTVDGITSNNIIDVGAEMDTAYTLTGSLGADNIHGGTAADIITGGGGDDTIFGDGGADIITGNAGDDTFLYDGDAQLFGTGTGGGNLVASSINGGTTGESNGDIISFEGASAFTIVVTDDFTGITNVEKIVAFGANTNNISITLKADVNTLSGIDTIDLSADTAAGGTTTINVGAVTGTGFTLIGSAGVDTITGSAGADTITSGLLADVLDGGDGNDTFIYKATGDLFTGTAIVDDITGGNGTDVISIDNSAGTTFTIDGGDLFSARIATVETIKAFGATAQVITITLDDSASTAGLFNVDLSADTNALGANVIDATAETTFYNLTGSDGVDTITGSTANDFISGRDGADVLDGGAGDDAFFYFVSTDLFNGGTLFDASITGGDGTADNIRINNNGGSTFTILGTDDWTNVATVEQITVFADTDQAISITLKADADAVAGLDTIDLSNDTDGTGGHTINVALETTSAYSLIGSAGIDTITGGGGVDTITGGGNDIIIGGGDADVINGGGGADTFFYTGGASVAAATTEGGDLITGFATASDEINLTSFGQGYVTGDVVDGSGATAGIANGAVLFFIGGALGTADQGFADTTTEVVSLLADGTSGNGNTGMTNFEFIMVTAAQTGAAAGGTNVWFVKDESGNGVIDTSEVSLIANLTDIHDGSTSLAATDFV